MRATHPGVLGALVAMGAALTPSFAVESAAQGLSGDAFVSQVVGEWTGRGEYQGNALTLSRSWTLELGNQFLRADMRVGMPNGASFGAVQYWQKTAQGVYSVVWMDGLGRSQRLEVTRDPDSGIVSTTYLDAFAEGGPEWRTWEFEASGADSYQERLYGAGSQGRTLLTVFSFEREQPSP